MEINLTQLVAQFLPPQFQAYFFLIMFCAYVLFNAITPFLSKYKFNGLEHMIYLAFTELTVNKDTKQITLELPVKQSVSTEQPAPAEIKSQEETPNENVQQVSASQPDPSITL